MIAELCRERLRSTHRDQLALVEEFILEIEGTEEDPACWSRFSDVKRDTQEMLGRVEAEYQSWLNPGSL